MKRLPLPVLVRSFGRCIGSLWRRQRRKRRKHGCGRQRRQGHARCWAKADAASTKGDVQVAGADFGPKGDLVLLTVIEKSPRTVLRAIWPGPSKGTAAA